MIKILFYVDTTLASGGAEKVLRTLVNNMDQTEFDITVQTTWPEEADRFLIPGIKYKSLFPRRNNLNRFRFRLETELGLTYSLRMKDDYDIEVAYLESGPTKVLASSSNNKAVKLAWVHCDLYQMTHDPALFAKKTAAWYKKYQKVVCVSETVKSSFTKLFGNRPEPIVLYNTVDNNEILWKASKLLPDIVHKRKVTVVTVGRMYPAKGYDRLLRAHKRLRDDGYDFDLWILGDGPERKDLEAYIDDNALRDSVFLPGFQTNPYPFIAAADMVVCSSRYEGFSTVVTESLILGKPVVTTNCSGMKELLGDSEYGLIMENSEEGIYLGLKKLLDDPWLRAEYKVKAQERGQAFSKDKLVKATEDFFISTLEANRAP